MRKRVLILLSALMVICAFVWLAFRHPRAGPLALFAVVRTNALGKPQVILQFTNGTARDQRILFVNVERKTPFQWEHDKVAAKTFKCPVLIAPKFSGFVMTCDLPEPKARQRYTMLCLPERNRVERFVKEVRSLLGELRESPIQEILTAEVEP